MEKTIILGSGGLLTTVILIFFIKVYISRETTLQPPGTGLPAADQETGFRAELIDPVSIFVSQSIAAEPEKEEFLVIDAHNKEYAIDEILGDTDSGFMIRMADSLDIRRVYFIQHLPTGSRIFCSFDGWFRNLYSEKQLGANVMANMTTVRVFAPRADTLRIYLYRNKDDRTAYRVEDMFMDRDGVWEIEFNENLHGVYYDFTVHGPDDPGNHFFGTNPVHITDPYARVSDDTWGKCRISEKTVPASPLKKGRPELKDLIAYEVHVQDFTDLLPVEGNRKGTFSAMMTRGLVNSRGEKIGFDYLLDLGINAVHLMPVQEYLHYPDEDWSSSFKDDPYMIRRGISEENYQWGYRTSHAFAIESRYRTRGSEPGREREEFRDLVQAFHDEGLAVIIDIVPNHTAENMDGNEWYFNFNAIDKLYYYRTRNFNHIGAYGNEVKTENRPMVRRWLIDQCRHFIEEFGIDGFRIDLAGQIDRQTLIKLKEELGQDIIVYGEAWIGSNDPEFEASPEWDWYKQNAPITFFQDDSRNAFKGPVFELKDKFKDRGWPGGNFVERCNVMKGLACKFPDDRTPLSGINYLDIHDNFTLADQFATDNFDGRLAVDQDLYKIAVTLLYTSLGPIVTQGGSEMMRSKASAPLEEVVKETRAGFRIYMHGKRDTYNLRKANQFIWENAGKGPEGKNHNDYANMYRFWQGMNRFRSSQYGSVFRVGEAVPEGYYSWIVPDDKSQLGYIVDERVLVLLNAGSKKNSFRDIYLPTGNWRLIANNREADHLKGVRDRGGKEFLHGGQSIQISMPAGALRIWVKD